MWVKLIHLSAWNNKYKASDRRSQHGIINTFDCGQTEDTCNNNKNKYRYSKTIFRWNRSGLEKRPNDKLSNLCSHMDLE